MKNLYPSVLYFSKEKTASKEFEEWLKGYNGNDLRPFPLYKCCNLKDSVEPSARELKRFLRNFKLELLSSLVIIVDYLSFSKDEREKKELSRMLLELILEYPEVKFVFDEFNLEINHHRCSEDNIEENTEECSYLTFLSINKKVDIRRKIPTKENFPVSVLLPSIHSFKTSKAKHDYEDLKLLLDGNSNIFDASNIRTTIKAYFFSNIKIHLLDTYANYFNTQKSRSENLALCIEEEKSQCLFNSYAMFASGYRVCVINSATELKYENRRNKNIDPKCSCRPKIIIRDYDLQFEDQPEDTSEIFKIRGYDRLSKKCTIGQPKLVNEYWDKVKNVITVFITQASENEIDFKEITHNSDKYRKCEYGGFIEGKGSIWGLQKPINGIYDLRNNIKEISDVVSASKHEEDAPFCTKRIGDENRSGHSASPFIYHIAESLIYRAKLYYKNESYLLAAILSREALEVLNGFHKTLMWDAIHLNAIAENALIMSQVGCNDNKLALNLDKRLDEIKKEVKRISVKEKPESDKRGGNQKRERISGEDQREATKNVLLQIYSDIRTFCRNKEYFHCADIALKKMVHEEYKVKCFKEILTGIFDNFKHLTLTGKETSYHWKHFKWPIVFLLLLCAFSWLYNWFGGHFVLLPYIAIGFFVITLLTKPMYVVFSLVTTRGDIKKFFLMLTIVTTLFCCTYYFGFFRNAGISYDINAPQIAYNMFIPENDDLIEKEGLPHEGMLMVRDTLERRRRIAIEQHDHGIIITNWCRSYKEVTFMFVLSNTIQTTLEQGATDFFNNVMNNYKPETRIKKNLFRTIVLLHIMISWIFLGVFISMLYQKFRNS